MSREQRGIDRLSEEIELQRRFFEGSVPVYDRLLQAFERALPGELGQRLEQAWAERVFRAVYERPLLLVAGLRYDALGEGPSHPLHAALAAEQPDVEAVTDAALAQATSAAHTDFFEALRARAIQTNETSRAVTWLWPAHLLARAGRTQPLTLVDLGTSAGLNLVADDLPMPWIDADGGPLGLTPRPIVHKRIGLDLAPLDALDGSSARWLRACVWPGDNARIARLEQGLAAFARRSSGPDAPRLYAGSLANVGDQLSALADDTCVLAFQSIVRDYLPPEVRADFEGAMRAQLLARPPRSTIYAQLELAADAPSPEQMAALDVQFVDARGRLRELTLARTHAHPMKLFVRAPAVTEFVAAFAEDS